MAGALLYDCLQFAVTATFHCLFPQLTIGLGDWRCCGSWAYRNGELEKGSSFVQG